MKSNFKRILFIALIILTNLIFVSNFAEAKNYKIHEQIPGQSGQSGTINGTNYGGKGIDTLQEYLEAAYKFGIAIVAILAVVMIGIGGFMYIVTSAGNAGKLANAKEIITSAIIGLVMALLSWLILFVVNPDLVGNVLEGVALEQDNNAWKNDSDPDPGICDDKLSMYESGECAGDYVCSGDTCVPKKNICTTDANQAKITGVCHINDSVAKTDDECGVMVGAQNLSGTCVKGNNCSGGNGEISSGKRCVDGSICCEGAGGATPDHYGR